MTRQEFEDLVDSAWKHDDAQDRVGNLLTLQCQLLFRIYEQSKSPLQVFAETHLGSNIKVDG